MVEEDSCPLKSLMFVVVSASLLNGPALKKFSKVVSEAPSASSAALA